MSISTCQKSQLTFLQATLNALEAAAHKVFVGLIYTLADLIDAIFTVAGVALAGVVALGQIFLAGVQAVVELVASAVGGLASAIQSVVNAFGGKCTESNSVLKALQSLASGLTSLSNTLKSWANQIGLWIQNLQTLQTSLAAGPGFAAYVKSVIS